MIKKIFYQDKNKKRSQRLFKIRFFLFLLIMYRTSDLYELYLIQVEFFNRSIMNTIKIICICPSNDISLLRKLFKVIQVFQVEDVFDSVVLIS